MRLVAGLEDFDFIISLMLYERSPTINWCTKCHKAIVNSIFHDVKVDMYLTTGHTRRLTTLYCD